MTFAILAFTFSLSQFYRAFLAVLSVDLERDLGATPSELGFVAALWLYAFAAGQLPVGWSLDRFGPRWTLLAFMVPTVAGAIWLPLARGVPDLAAAMALVGLGCAPMLMASYLLFARSYPPERFVVLASLIVGVGALGDLASATPLALLADRVGWRGALGFAAALPVVSAVLIAVALPDPPGQAQAGDSGLKAGFLALLRLRPLRRLLPLIAVGYGVLIATRGLWISPYLISVHGFDQVQAGAAAFALALATAIGAFAYGPLTGRIGGPKQAALAGSVVCIAALSTLALAGPADARLSLGCFVVLGLAGMTYPVLMAHGRAFLPDRLIGRGVALLNVAFMGGAATVQAASSAFVGRLQAADWPPEQLYRALFAALAATLLAAVAVYATSQPAAARS